MTEADKIKEADAKVRRRILLFSAQAEAWLVKLISEVGGDWLETALPERARKEAAYSVEFWNWFRNQWAIQDSQLSERLKVDKQTTHLHFSVNEYTTVFMQSHGEFRLTYEVFHRDKAELLRLPTELVARWITNKPKVK